MKENLMEHTSSMVEKVIYCVLLCIAFLSPLFFIPNTFISPQFSTSLLFATGVILSAVCFIGLLLKKGTIDLPSHKSFFYGSFIAIPVVYTLSSLSHGFSRMSFIGYTFDLSTVGFILLGFLFMYLIMYSFKTKERVFYSYIAIVLSLLGVAVFIGLRLVFGAEFLSFGLFNDLTTTMVGGWNSTGMFFGVGVILSLLTYEMLSLTQFSKVLTSIALATSLFLLSLVNFNPIWIIITIVAGLFLVYRVFINERSGTTSLFDKVKKIPKMSLAVFLIAVTFSVTGSVLGNTVANFFGVSSIDVRPTLGVTVDIIKNTLKTELLFGSGPNTFVSQWLSYKPADINTTVFWNTDFSYGVGLLPTFVVTTGILGALSWIVFFILYIRFGIKAIFKKTLDEFSLYLVASSFFVSLYLWIMACIYVPSIVMFIYTLFFTGVFFATLHITEVVTLDKYTFNENPKSGFITTIVLLSVLVLIGFLGYGIINNSRSLWYFQKGTYTANTEGNLIKAEEYIGQAVSLVPYDVYYRTQSELSIAKIGILLSQDLSKANKEEVQKVFTDELAKAITSASNAQKADSSNYLNWIALGRAYEIAVPPQTEVRGAYEEAVKAYTKAMELNPHNPGIKLLFARLESSKNNLKKAKEYTIQAINEKQNYIDAYYLLSQIEVADKNLKGAIDSVSAAALIEPNNPAIFFQLGLLYYNGQDFKNAILNFNKSLGLAPDYANSKYFLGLSRVLTGDIQGAIKLFEELKVTNPTSQEVEFILTNLKAGKSPFANAQPPVNTPPEKRSTLPVKENQ